MSDSLAFGHLCYKGLTQLACLPNTLIQGGPGNLHRPSNLFKSSCEKSLPLMREACQ